MRLWIATFRPFRAQKQPQLLPLGCVIVAYLSQLFKSFHPSIFKVQFQSAKPKKLHFETQTPIKNHHALSNEYASPNGKNLYCIKQRKGGIQLYHLSSQLHHFCENDQIEFSNFAKNKTFYSILKYFVANQNLL